MKKTKYQENLEPKREHEKKANIRRILNQKENVKKNRNEENPEPRKKYDKNKYDKNHQQKQKIVKRCLKRTKNV